MLLLLLLLLHSCPDPCDYHRMDQGKSVFCAAEISITDPLGESTYNSRTLT